MRKHYIGKVHFHEHFNQDLLILLIRFNMQNSIAIILKMNLGFFQIFIAASQFHWWKAQHFSISHFRHKQQFDWIGKISNFCNTAVRLHSLKQKDTMWVTYKDNTITAFKTFVIWDAAQALQKAASPLPVLLLSSTREEREATSRTSKRWVWALAQASPPFPTSVGKVFQAAFPKIPTDIIIGSVLVACLVFTSFPT